MNTLLVAHRTRASQIPRQRGPEPSPALPRSPDPWALIAPAGAVVEWRPRASRLRNLPRGTTIVLVVGGPLARWRLRRVAGRCAIALDRALIVVPTVSAPLALVDDRESAVRYFWSHLATVPPGLTRWYPVACFALAVARRLPWAWQGSCALGYAAVGVRQ